MSEQVEVEVITVSNRYDKRMARITESQRQANEIAVKRNAKTKANREKYARPKN